MYLALGVVFCVFGPSCDILSRLQILRSEYLKFSHRCGTSPGYASGRSFFGPVAVHISQVRLVFRLDRFPVFSSDTLRRVRSDVLCSGARELRCGDCGAFLCARVSTVCVLVSAL